MMKTMRSRVYSAAWEIADHSLLGGSDHGAMLVRLALSRPALALVRVAERRIVAE